MAWARITDDFLDHPKVAELAVDLEGMAAVGLWTLALCWVRADRRRQGVVPLGIALRLSAGNGKQLASRLVHAGLWDEVDGGYRFHDYEDVYTPADLSEKRAEAGRSGGKASGRARAQKAASRQVKPSADNGAKQVASSKTRTSRTPESPNATSLFDDDDPLTAGSSTPTKRSNDEANPKQPASKTVRSNDEASHARAGATTHYPEASNEASSSAPAAQPGETEGQRVNRVTRVYTDQVKLTNFLAVQQIVKDALRCGDYTEAQVIAGLKRLADSRSTVTKNTLRHAIEGTNPWPSNGTTGGRDDRQHRRPGDFRVQNTHEKTYEGFPT